uniref:Distal-less-like homeobox protein N-terminal domain-containing protein n=1 Tax=Cairina moschata TaxID=8855 RepID=A0A8C3BS40_CAIMO
MTGVLESLVPDMHASQISAGGYQQQQQQQQHGGLHKPQESPTLPVSTATDSSYYTNQQHGAAGGPPYGPLGSYPYAAGGAAPYSAKAGYDLGYAGAYGSYGPYGARASPASNDPGTSEPRGGPAGARRGRARGPGEGAGRALVPGGAAPTGRAVPAGRARGGGDARPHRDCRVCRSREGGLRAGDQDSERQAEESAEAADHLLQLPAGGPAAALPENPVPRPARESGAGGLPRPHPDAGRALPPRGAGTSRPDGAGAGGRAPSGRGRGLGPRCLDGPGRAGGRGVAVSGPSQRRSPRSCGARPAPARRRPADAALPPGEDLVPEPPLQVQEDVEERRDPGGAPPAPQRLAAAPRLAPGLGLRRAPAHAGRPRQPQPRRRLPRHLPLVPDGARRPRAPAGGRPPPAAAAAPAPPRRRHLLGAAETRARGAPTCSTGALEQPRPVPSRRGTGPSSPSFPQRPPQPK